MPNLKRIFLLINLMITTEVAVANDLPRWITQTSMSDSQFYYLTCSHDGLDPEDVRQIAENKCLASAAKLGGVEVTISQKTVQSLTGSDSSEVAEIQPLHRNISCEWTDRYLEKVGQGFRVWLRCRVSRQLVAQMNTNKSNDSLNGTPTKISKASISGYKRAIMTITTVPQSDRILVGGENGERVVEVSSNVVKVELKEGDEYILVKKQKFKDLRRNIAPWKHGDTVSQTFYLEEEL